MSKPTRLFREKVQEIAINAKAKIPGTPRLAIFYAFYPPDKRRRDIGNYEKQTTDALMEAGVFEDDEQIDFIWLVRRPQIKGGQIKVVIVEHDGVMEMLEHYQEIL
jgi:Holliday junction resolvase RusA-like endonuclease